MLRPRLLACLALAAAAAAAVPARADVRPIDAGPIWSDWDAQDKCPNVCDAEGRSWTGDWRTVPGAMTSTCDCKRGRGRKSGGNLAPPAPGHAVCVMPAPVDNSPVNLFFLQYQMSGPPLAVRGDAACRP